MSQRTEILIGHRIKYLRTSQELTLRSLAEKCGLSANAISLIERGENSATISSLEKIAKALNVSINDLFQRSDHESIFHLKCGQGLKKVAPNFEMHSLGYGLQNRQMDPYFVTVFPCENRMAKPISHPGQEFVYCLSGEVEIFVSDKQFHIGSGDSLLFDAMHLHGWTNPHPQKANLLIIFQSLSDPDLAQQQHIEMHMEK